MTARRVITGLVLVVIALLGWLLLAPQQLGGPVAVVSTYGDSMLPTYTASDLVVVATAGDYDVGDIVAYRSEELGAVVLHRIVDIDENGYVTQGDNNDFLDPDRPTDDELMGTARLRIPGAGRLLEAPTPVRAAMVALLGALALFGGRQVARRRARRPAPDTPNSKLLSYVRRRRTTGRPRPSVAATDGDRGFAWVGWPLTTALVAGAVAALALALAVAAFARPATAAGNLDYTHRGTFTYTADVPTGAVYPEGEVTTGDPIFLQLVDTLGLTLTYELDGPGGAVEPSGRLWVELANGTGWSTRSSLSDREDGDAGTLVLEGTLDIPQLRRTLADVQEETGVGGGGPTIAVTAEIDVTGSVAGEPLTDHFAPELVLQLEEARLVPQDASATDDAAADGPDSNGVETTPGLARSKTGSVTLPNAEPARLEVAGRGLDVTTARVIALAVLVAALVALAVAAAAAARQHNLEETARIRLRYGSRLIEVAALDVPAGYGIVDVRDMADLVSLADRTDRPVLHHRSATTDSYVVEGDAAVYRYRIEVAPDEPIAADTAGEE